MRAFGNDSPEGSWAKINAGVIGHPSPLFADRKRGERRLCGRSRNISLSHYEASTIPWGLWLMIMTNSIVKPVTLLENQRQLLLNSLIGLKTNAREFWMWVAGKGETLCSSQGMATEWLV